MIPDKALITGSCIAIGVVAGLFKVLLAHLERMADRHDAAIATIQARQEKFLGNHMSGNTRALERVADQLEALVDRTRP